MAGGPTFPCPSCASPLVLASNGGRFVCSERDAGCFESLPSAGDLPYDVTPHDGPYAAARVLSAKDRVLDLAGAAREAGALLKGDWYAAVGAILETESLLYLGRIRRKLERRMAARGAAS